jgi:hypothetical protein
MDSSLLVERTQQLILLSAFLGGFSATFLAAILTIEAKKKVTDWIVCISAASSCCFIVAAVTNIALVNGLQIEESLVTLSRLKIISSLGMISGIFALLICIGLSGWIRNRKIGLVTASFALIATIIVGIFV